ncbi:hypothetical protein [Flagellimonas sp.]
MEKCIPCENIAQHHFAEVKKRSVFQTIFDFLDLYPIEGAEFMSKTK